MDIFILECAYFFLCISTHLCILVKKDENCRSIRTENSLALLIPNHFVLDDCPRVNVDTQCFVDTPGDVSLYYSVFWVDYRVKNGRSTPQSISFHMQLLNSLAECMWIPDSKSAA